MEAAEESDRIPDGLAKQNDGSGGDRYADEGIQRHSGRKPQDLTNHLCALGFGVACEVRNVEGNRSPKANHASERGKKQPKELGCGMEFAGCMKNRTHAARFTRNPKKKDKPDDQHKRSAETFEELDRFNAAPDDEHVGTPKKEEAERRAARKICRARPSNAQHRVDGLAADPGLDAKPAAGHQSTQDGRYIGPANAE